QDVRRRQDRHLHVQGGPDPRFPPPRASLRAAERRGIQARRRQVRHRRASRRKPDVFCPLHVALTPRRSPMRTPRRSPTSWLQLAAAPRSLYLRCRSNLVVWSYRIMLPCCAVLLLCGFVTTTAAQDLPKMKFNEVKEIAPGVYFRYSDIRVPFDLKTFGGSNNIWIVFEDYVLVYDANFPKEAGDVVAAIRKTTDKPIRYVLDSHHHGDHAYGNAVFAKEGATVIAQTNCARLLRINGPKEFEDAGKGKDGREDVRKSFLKVPDLIFDQKLVFEDKKQKVELL